MPANRTQIAQIGIHGSAFGHFNFTSITAQMILVLVYDYEIMIKQTHARTYGTRANFHYLTTITMIGFVDVVVVVVDIVTTVCRHDVTKNCTE